MKLKTLLLSTLLAASAHAAVTVTGQAMLNVQGIAGTDLPAGRLGIVVVDTGADGFLMGHVTATGGTLNTTTVQDSLTDLLSNVSSLNIGSTFGGDLVIARYTTLVASGDTVMNTGNWNLTDASAVGKNFAIIWFDLLTSASVGNAAAGTNFGIVRGTDWITPASNTGTKSFGTGTGSTVYDQITLGSPASAPAGAGVSLSTNNGSMLQIVPEPSSALLGALGALGLLRRRRI